MPDSSYDAIEGKYAKSHIRGETRKSKIHEALLLEFLELVEFCFEQKHMAGRPMVKTNLLTLKKLESWMKWRD